MREYHQTIWNEVKCHETDRLSYDIFFVRRVRFSIIKYNTLFMKKIEDAP